ncbi:Cysteine-rich secretory protein 2 [Clonorchis sinensis]|uniref:Cysteine-rich secretory protein 2 n=1 Tax=Clonorchis sinensis TaxID=79923 RepID=A0A419QCY2_CLOSI|nr:Cysteine-rich secretory protein 2 [Clonorchis sinensis]
MSLLHLCLLSIVVLSSQVNCQTTATWVVAMLEQHNEARANVSRCIVPGLPPAKRLMPLMWDAALQRQAQLHANKCTLDEASMDDRKTTRFSHVGQASSTGNVAKNVLSRWFNEYKKLDIITNHCNSCPCRDFRMVISDQVTHIGCAVGNCKETPVLSANFVTVCFYAPYTHDKHRPVYEFGTEEDCIP